MASQYVSRGQRKDSSHYHRWSFEFLRMPYGLSTAPATFARAIGIILSGLTYDTCLCYFDDVIIFSKTIE